MIKRNLYKIKVWIRELLITINTKNTFARNLAIAFSGNSIVLALGFILTPFLAKIYGPESYGQFAIFTSTCSLIIPFVSFQYPNGFVATKNRKELFTLVRLSFIILIAFTILSITVVKLLPVYSGIDIVQLKIFDYLPYYILFSGIFIILRGMNLNLLEYGRAAKSKGIATLCGKLSSLGMGVTITTTGKGLILGNLVLLIIESTLLISKKVYTQLIHSFTTKIRISEYKSAIQNFKEYPTYVSFNSFIYIVSSQLPIYVIAIYFSKENVGLFSLSQSLIVTPLFLLGTSISLVFLPKISNLIDNKPERNNLVLKLYAKIFYFGAIGLFALSLALYWFLVPLLGQEWSGASILSALIANSFAFTLVSLPLSVTYRIIGQEKDNFKLSLVAIVTKAIGLYIGIYLNDFYISVFCYFLAGLLIDASQIFLLFWKLEIKTSFLYRDAVVIGVMYSLFFYIIYN